MGVKMKNSVLIRCSRCGITQRHSKPECFADEGWTARNFTPLCPRCESAIDEYEEIRKYFEFLKSCEAQRIAALRTKKE